MPLTECLLLDDAEIGGRLCGMGGGGAMPFIVWRLQEDCELLIGGVAPPYEEFRVEEDLVVGMLGAEPLPLPLMPLLLLESVPSLFCLLKLDLLRRLRSRKKAGITVLERSWG